MSGAPVTIRDASGREAHVLPLAGSTERLALRLDTGERVEVERRIVEQSDDGSYRLPFPFDDLLRTEAERITLAEEQLRVSKRLRETGRVRVTKRVDQRKETVDEPLLHEEVDVERIPIDRYVDAPIPTRTEGDTTIVSVLEEVLVVEKRLLLKEEVRITKRRTERRHTQDITLRSERVEVERSGEGDTPS